MMIRHVREDELAKPTKTVLHAPFDDRLVFLSHSGHRGGVHSNLWTVLAILLTKVLQLTLSSQFCKFGIRFVCVHVSYKYVCV